MISKGRFYFIFTLAFFLGLSTVWADQKLVNHIPLKPGLRTFSQDLLWRGKSISPRQIKKNVSQGRISTSEVENLMPQETGLWRDEGHIPDIPDEQKLSIQAGDRTNFEAFVTTRYKEVGFNAQHTATKTRYMFRLGRRIHDALIRKEFLRRLGYRVPAMKRLATLRLDFETQDDKQEFLNHFETQELMSADAWVAENPQNQNYLILQDVLVMESLLSQDREVINLAFGALTSSRILGRRALETLLIPFAMTRFPESLNHFIGGFGQVDEDYLRLPFEVGAQFVPTYEGARWMIKRICRLSRPDFDEIASGGGLPNRAAETLVTERLIDSRNQLVTRFELEKNCPLLPADLNRSDVPGLVDGKLEFREEWPGYARDFTAAPPKSPFTLDEVLAYVFSEVQSNVLAEAVSKLNESFLTLYDPNDGLREELFDRLVDDLLHFLETGDDRSNVLDAHFVRYAGANLIVGRNIHFGDILGTSAGLAQIVDTIGVSVEAGGMGLISGLPTGFRLSGRAGGSVTRTYSHLRPVVSMKGAIKTPLSELMVMVTKQRWAGVIDEILTAEFQELSSFEQSQKVNGVVKELDALIAVGESLIVTDSLGGQLSVTAGYSHLETLEAYAQFYGESSVLSRLHVRRTTKDQYQVYVNGGRLTQVGVQFTLGAAKVPIVRLDAATYHGQIGTRFHALEVSEKGGRTTVNSLKALHDLFASEFNFINKTTESLDFTAPPIEIDITFDAEQLGLNFLFIESKRQRDRAIIKVTHPSGDSRLLFTYDEAKRHGVQLVRLASDAANALIDEFFNGVVSVNFSSANSDPGRTPYGYSYARTTAFEGLVKSEPSYFKDGEPFSLNSPLDESFLRIRHSWKSWSMSRERTMELIRNLNFSFESNFIPESWLAGTEAIKLFEMNLDVSLYEKGFQRIFRITEKEAARDLFIEYSNLNERRYPPRFRSTEDDDPERTYERDKRRHLNQMFGRFWSARKAYLEAEKHHVVDEMARQGVKMFSILEEMLTLEGLLVFIGGEENIYITASINGFREGDPNGDTVLVANSIGLKGARAYKGPARYIRDLFSVTNGEFFGLWLRRVLD